MTKSVKKDLSVVIYKKYTIGCPTMQHLFLDVAAAVAYDM